MHILTIRTDKPEAEIGLFEDNMQQAYEVWQAHRELAETIHQKISTLLAQNNVTIDDLQGIVVYHGPGSFTGLRIGISIANAFAYGCVIPIVGTETEAWKEKGIIRLQDRQNDHVVIPAYGAPVHITMQKK